METSQKEKAIQMSEKFQNFKKTYELIKEIKPILITEEDLDFPYSAEEKPEKEKNPELSHQDQNVNSHD